jgi:hypothetical protein
MQGVMLLNPAIVEPGYEGPLSCFLVNFSSKRVQIRPDEPISKIIFHKMTGAPVNLSQVQLSTDKYATELSSLAAHYHRSFMDVSGIEARAAESAEKAVRKWVIGGGIFVGVLLFFHH